MPAVLTLLACFALVCIAGCGKREAALATGAVIAGSTLPGWKGDDAYAEVNSAALPELYAHFRGTLSDHGLTKWDARFDCNHLADLYIAVAQARFAAAAWHASTGAQALALAVVWYRRDNGGRHALVEARTELGVQYIDVTAGPAPVRLSPTEVASIYFRKW